ncbi:hypothetical protein [Shewanella sp. SR44-3]|uniref:hypothetical protein n=1 Tax=unclassified Shewanella TaxID=196818 RepID=UPI0015FA1F5B|nr:hypothetical protein [Shewanella sp. SR44-3]MBB1268892.1 hypothetical protein [Shewanella sp. SR44-3]
MDIATQMFTKRLGTARILHAFILSVLVAPMMLAADQTSVISTKLMQGAGRAAVNQASGDHNIQSNSHAFGKSTSIESIQQNDLQPLAPISNVWDLQAMLDEDELHVSFIDSQAFANFQGLASINQVSGQNNIQTNLGSVALDSIVGLGLSDTALTQVSSQQPPSFQTSQYHAEIAPDSFLDAQGVMQINQISGDGNIAVNQFSLQLPSGNL